MDETSHTMFETVFECYTCHMIYVLGGHFVLLDGWINT